MNCRTWWGCGEWVDRHGNHEEEERGARTSPGHLGQATWDKLYFTVGEIWKPGMRGMPGKEKHRIDLVFFLSSFLLSFLPPSLFLNGQIKLLGDPLAEKLSWLETRSSNCFQTQATSPQPLESLIQFNKCLLNSYCTRGKAREEL